MIFVLVLVRTQYPEYTDRTILEHEYIILTPKCYDPKASFMG
jgi:hypothetical protein